MTSKIVILDLQKTDRRGKQRGAAQAPQTAPEGAESPSPAPAEGPASARIRPARPTTKTDSDAAGAAAQKPIPKSAIPPRQLAINLFSSGWTFLQTAAGAGVEPATLEAWGKQPEFRREIDGILHVRQCCLRARALNYSFKAMDALLKMVEDDSPAASQIRLQAAMFLVQMSCYTKPE